MRPAAALLMALAGGLMAEAPPASVVEVAPEPPRREPRLVGRSARGVPAGVGWARPARTYRRKVPRTAEGHARLAAAEAKRARRRAARRR